MQHEATAARKVHRKQNKLKMALRIPGFQPSHELIGDANNVGLKEKEET